jgi:hypothetical protein
MRQKACLLAALASLNSGQQLQLARLLCGHEVLIQAQCGPH